MLQNEYVKTRVFDTNIYFSVNLYVIMMKLKYAILAILVSLAIGFFVGRATVNTNEIVRYVKGETVVRAVPVPKPYMVEIPKVYYLPTRMDTVLNVQVVDTARIIEDYVSVKRYSIRLFNDKYGKLDLQPTLQYNTIKDLQYSFTPNVKEVIRYREKAIVPFVSASWNTLNFVGAGGGVFIGNFGIEYNFMFNPVNKQNFHSLSAKYKL